MEYDSNQQLPEPLLDELMENKSCKGPNYAAPFFMLPSCSADPGGGMSAYQVPRETSGETQNTPHRSQMFQQNVTHVHGDMIAQQNNIDVATVEQNVIHLAEIRHETAIHEMQQTVVNAAETRHENVVTT